MESKPPHAARDEFTGLGFTSRGNDRGETHPWTVHQHTVGPITPQNSQRTLSGPDQHRSRSPSRSVRAASAGLDGSEGASQGGSPRADSRGKRSPRAKPKRRNVCLRCFASASVARSEAAAILQACAPLIALDGTVQAILGQLRQAQRSISGTAHHNDTLNRYQMLAVDVARRRQGNAKPAEHPFASPLLHSGAEVSPLNAANFARELHRSPLGASAGISTASPFLELVRNTAERTVAAAGADTAAGAAVSPGSLFRVLDATIEQAHDSRAARTVSLSGGEQAVGEWVSGLRQAHWHGGGARELGSGNAPFRTKQAWALARVPLRVLQAANAFMANCVRAASRRDAAVALLVEHAARVKLLRQMQCPTSCTLSLHHQRVTEGKYTRAARAVAGAPHLLQAIAMGADRTRSSSAFLGLHSAAASLTGSRADRGANISRPGSVEQAAALALQVIGSTGDASSGAAVGNSPLCLALAVSGTVPTASTLQAQSAYAKEFQMREKLGRAQVPLGSLHPVMRMFAVVPVGFMRSNSKALMRAASRHVMRRVQSRTQATMQQEEAFGTDESHSRSLRPVGLTVATTDAPAATSAHQGFDSAQGWLTSPQPFNWNSAPEDTPQLITPSSFLVDRGAQPGATQSSALQAANSFRHLKHAARVTGTTPKAGHEENAARVPTPSRRVMIQEVAQRTDTDDIGDIDAVSVNSGDLFLNDQPLSGSQPVEQTRVRMPASASQTATGVSAGPRETPAARAAAHRTPKARSTQPRSSSHGRVNGWRTAIQRFPRLLHILQQLSAVQLLAQQAQARDKLVQAANQRQETRAAGKRRLRNRLRAQQVQSTADTDVRGLDDGWARDITAGSGTLGRSVVQRSQGNPPGLLDTATSALHSTMSRSHATYSSTDREPASGLARDERLRSLRQRSRRQKATKSRSGSRRAVGAPQLSGDALRLMRSVQPPPFSSHDTSAAGMLAAGRLEAKLPTVARRTSVHTESQKTLTLGKFAGGGFSVDLSGRGSASTPNLHRRSDSSGGASVASGTTGYSGRSGTAFGHLVPHVAGAVSMGRGRFKQQQQQRARERARETVHDRLHKHGTASSGALPRGGGAQAQLHSRGGHQYVLVHSGAISDVEAAAADGGAGAGSPANRLHKPDGTPLSLLELLDIADDNSSELSGTGASGSDSENSADLIVGNVDVRAVLRRADSRDGAVFGVQEADIEEFQAWVDGVGVSAAVQQITEASARGQTHSRVPKNAPMSPRPAVVGAALLGFIRHDKQKRRQQRNQSAVRKLASLAALNQAAGPWGFRVARQSDAANNTDDTPPPAALQGMANPAHGGSKAANDAKYMQMSNGTGFAHTGAYLGLGESRDRGSRNGRRGRTPLAAKHSKDAPARAVVMARVRQASAQYAKTASQSAVSFLSGSGKAARNAGSANGGDGLLPVISAADFVMAQQLTAEKRQARVQHDEALGSPARATAGGPSLSLLEVSTQRAFHHVATPTAVPSPIRKRQQAQSPPQASSSRSSTQRSSSPSPAGSQQQGRQWPALQSPFPQLQQRSGAADAATTPMQSNARFSWLHGGGSSPFGGSPPVSSPDAAATMSVSSSSSGESSRSDEGASPVRVPMRAPEESGSGGHGRPPSSTLPPLRHAADSAVASRSRRLSALGPATGPAPITSLGSFVRRVQSPDTGAREVLRADAVLNSATNRVDEAFAAQPQDPVRQATAAQRATRSAASASSVRQMLTASREGGERRRLQGMHAAAARAVQL